jgi:hypothetical protein
MKKTRIFLVLLCVFLVSACAAATKPNVSALYEVAALKPQLPVLPAKSEPDKQLPPEVQTLFQKLYTLDPTFALEAGKLPEFQGEIGQNQILALTRFTNLVANASPAEKADLTDLMKIGLPDFRRYCTPLQAIFWLLEKKQYNSEENLLHSSWLFKRMYIDDLLSRAWDFSEIERWDDYNTVVERLNAPELVNYYEKRRFSYTFRADHVGNSLALFKKNSGQCADATDFTVDCLRRGGYKAYEYDVRSPTGNSYHHVTFFEMDGRGYIMDNGRPDKRGIVPQEMYSPY